MVGVHNVKRPPGRLLQITQPRFNEIPDYLRINTSPIISRLRMHAWSVRLSARNSSHSVSAVN